MILASASMPHPSAPRARAIRAQAPLLRVLAWLALTLAVTLGALYPRSARAELAVPPLTARVIDQTGTLDPTQRAALEQQLSDFESRKGSQIAVLIVASTEPETIEEYGIRVAEQWKLGRKGVDDGALLLIAKDDRALRIEVGYGLEGALNDATSKRIISEVIVPYFRQNNYAEGITAGVDRMVRVVDGEPLPPPKKRGATGTSDGLRQLGPMLLVVALVISSIFRSIFGRFFGAVATAGLIGFITWWLVGTLIIAIGAALVAFIFTLVGFAGAFMGGGRGGGGFGGGMGDVFRGGGGGFGGGGASGRW